MKMKRVAASLLGGALAIASFGAAPVLAQDDNPELRQCMRSCVVAYGGNNTMYQQCVVRCREMYDPEGGGGGGGGGCTSPADGPWCPWSRR